MSLGSPFWMSYYLPGQLTVHLKPGSSVKKDKSVSFLQSKQKPLMLQSKFAFEARGMELSELVAFADKIIAPDDRTGILYEIVYPSQSSLRPSGVSPWKILADGNGTVGNGFKGEWCTVKDGKLYVGGLGKAWTSPDGLTVINHNPMYVKVVDRDGHIDHIDWQSRYEALMEAVGVSKSGYMIHEAVAWSQLRRRWYFAPRRISQTESYDEVADESRGANIILTADESFADISHVYVKFDNGTSEKTSPGLRASTRGFSSIKFVPETADSYIIALRSEEFQGSVNTYMSSFDLDGTILMPERLVQADVKYEGIEFV